MLTAGIKKEKTHMRFDLHHGDCLAILRTLPDNSVDAVVADPPYGLSFMGKKWDYDVPAVEVWAECLRVLKPGGHLLAFAGTRTQHRMAVRIEDAGFEIRDMIAWVYGSGFPKSLDVSKAIDKVAGAQREAVGQGRGRTGAAAQPNGGSLHSDDNYQWPGRFNITAPATPDAQQWAGWGTALKPALEPITVARKPLIGTVAANVLAHGTGAINVDGCRVPGELEGDPNRFAKTDGGEFVAKFDNTPVVRSEGRWPANLIHDGGEFLGEQARFFYCAKASKADRDEGCEGLEEKDVGDEGRHTMSSAMPVNCTAKDGIARTLPRRNHHPTVKPTDLMRYLCRLVTPPGGTVLDPFMGSGSTGKAAILEGFSFIGIERESEYVEIARARIEAVSNQPKQQCLFG